jgi:hypothetical protein
MTIDGNTLLFFDASCLIAAAGSTSGGCGFLLSLCSRGFLKAALSQPVLLETQRNIQARFGDESIQRFYNLLVFTPQTCRLPFSSRLRKISLVKKQVKARADKIYTITAFSIDIPCTICYHPNKLIFK